MSKLGQMNVQLCANEGKISCTGFVLIREWCEISCKMRNCCARKSDVMWEPYLRHVLGYSIRISSMNESQGNASPSCQICVARNVFLQASFYLSKFTF